jgi:hypothetical protein
MLLVASSCAVLILPATTRRGVDFRVTEYTIPLYVKAIEFLQRHYQYELLVSRICAGKTADEDCASAIFDWTHENIPPTPPGWPVVDDHVVNIIIRGHGTTDQMADVFATLSTYAGMPAFFKAVKAPDRGASIMLTFARVGGVWTVFDVERHVAFKDRAGRFASVDALIADPKLVDAQIETTLPGGAPYSAFISKAALLPFAPPIASHADLQQPWPRIRYEVRKLMGQR